MGNESEAQRDFEHCLNIDPGFKSELDGLIKSARQALGRNEKRPD
jgi:hypothetical protein